MAMFDAGSVFVNLFFREDESGANSYERKIAQLEARSRKPIEKTLKWKYDEESLQKTEREIERRLEARKQLLVEGRLDKGSMAKLDAEVSKLTDKKRTIEVRLDNQASRALAQLDRDSQRSRKHIHDLANAFNPLNSRLTAFQTRIPLIGWGVMAAGIASIIPLAYSLASALGPVVGLLGAIPGLVATAGAALAAASLGLKGVGDALSTAWDASNAAAAKSAASSDKARDAARGLEKAEQNVQDALRNAHEAQEDLNEAREEARERVREMREEVERAALAERGAELSVREAYQALGAAEADQTTTSLELARARLAVREAEQDLKDTRRDGARNAEELREAEEQGINRMEEVVNARRRVVDAERAVQDAQEAVADAQSNAAKSAEALGGSTDQLAEKMQNLSPAGRSFVRFMQEELFPVVKDLQRTAQEGLLPGVERGLRAAMENLPLVTGVIKDYSDALGDAAERQGRFLGRADVGGDLLDIFGQGEQLIRDTTRALTFWERGLLHVGVAARPLIEWLGDINIELAKMFEQATEEGRESGALEDFFKRGIRNTELFIEALWDFGRGLINIGNIARRVWGQDLLKGINDAAERFRDWTESVRGAREIEQYFRRWRERWNDIADAVTGVITKFRELRREGKTTSEAFVIVFSEAIAESVIRAAGEIAKNLPRLIFAFAKGWVESDIWGKIAFPALLLLKFGGPAAFIKVGKAAGAWFGAAFGTSAAASAIVPIAGAARRGGRWTALGRGAGLTFGTAFGAVFTASLTSDVQNALRSLKDDVVDPWMERNLGEAGSAISDVRDFIGKNLPMGLPGTDLVRGVFGGRETEERGERLIQILEKIEDKSKAISPRRARELRDAIKDLDDVSDPARRELNRLVDTAEKRFEDGEQATDDWRLKIQTMVRDSQGKFADMRTVVQFNTRLIKEAMRDESGAGRKALSENLEAVVDVIRRTMRRGNEVTKRGLGLIRDAYATELRFYGLSPREAIAGANVRSGQVPGGFRRQDYANDSTGATGGWSSAQPYAYGGRVIGKLGERGRDLVHAILGRGEAVLNYPQQKIVNAALMMSGIQGLPGLFNMTRGTRHHLATGGFAGSFQTGGFAELLHPFNDPAGHGGANSHLHIAMLSRRALIRLGHWLQRQGWIVGEHPAFGGVQGRHDPDGYHYTGQAIDVNWPNAAQEATKIRQLLRILGQVVKGGRGRVPRVVIRGPRSPLRNTMQRVVDVARAGAQRNIDAAGSFGASMGLLSGDGNVERVFAQVARQLSTSKTASEALGMAGYAESGMRDLAYGDNTSQGALQLLASTASSMGIDPHNEAQISSAFLLRGFYGQGGANRLARTGLPSHLVAQGVQGSKYADGSNYLKMAGPARAWMRRFGLAGGGFAGIPFVGSFQRGGFAGFGPGMFGPEGFTGVGRQQARNFSRNVDALENKISDLGREYSVTSRGFDLSEEEFIIESDDPSVPPRFDFDAIRQRADELQKLIRIRETIVSRYVDLVYYLNELRKAWATVVMRLQATIAKVKGRIANLKGAKGKEARNTRDALIGRLGEYEKSLTDAKTKAGTFDRAWTEAGFDLREARLDVSELQQELSPLGITLQAGGEAPGGLELPDFTPGTTPDQEAIAEQERRRAQAAITERDSLRNALRTLVSAGDLGQGGPTAYAALVAPTGVPGPGYAVGPTGQFIPVTGPGGVTTSAAGGGGGFTTASAEGGINVHFHSAIPPTKEQAAMIGAAAVSGIDSQKANILSRAQVNV